MINAVSPYHGHVTPRFACCAFFLVVTAAAAQSDLKQIDPWTPREMLAPVTLAAQLQDQDSPRHVFFVGFPMLFKGIHIPQSNLAGPCSSQKGLDLLAEAVKPLPHDAEIIIYCGCCPLVRCPNVRPAFRKLKGLGYTNIKVLQLNTNLHTDWVEKGYPIELSTK
jgi:thiosulfate/3-mercaptopyruvate sulfurtransferase